MKATRPAPFFYYMDKKKTQLLTRLELLRDRVVQNLPVDDYGMPIFPSDNLAERIYKYQTIFHIHRVNLNLRSRIEISKNKIVLDQDYDVKYDYWTSPSTWGMPYQNYQYFVKWAPVEDGYDSTDANTITGYLPSAPKEQQFDDSTARQTLRDALTIMTGPYFNETTLEIAIHNALKEMFELLKEYQDLLHGKRTDEQYYNLTKTLLFKYRQGNIAEIKSNYDQEKELLEELSVEWIEERLMDALTELYHSKFMQKIIVNTPLKTASKTKILYSLQDIDKDHLHRFYKALSTISKFSKGVFDFSQHYCAIGKLICRHQNPFHNQEYLSLIHFCTFVEMINMDLIPLLENQTCRPNLKIKESIHKPDSCYMTFRLYGTTTTGHIELLRRKMIEFKWIAPETQPDDFQKLFSGNSCVCKITWTGGGKGNLLELFKLMKEKELITIPGGHGLATVLENHFVDSKGFYLTGLNKGSVSNKILPNIYKLIELMEISPNTD